MLLNRMKMQQLTFLSLFIVSYCSSSSFLKSSRDITHNYNVTECQGTAIDLDMIATVKTCYIAYIAVVVMNS